jgi:hypothetical protein
VDRLENEEGNPLKASIGDRESARARSRTWEQAKAMGWRQVKTLAYMLRTPAHKADSDGTWDDDEPYANLRRRTSPARPSGW